MAVYGGDLAQLDELARRFAEEVGVVEGLQTRITAGLQGTAWTGPASQRFRDQWTADFVPALNRLKDALGEGSAVVAHRRAAIERATG